MCKPSTSNGSANNQSLIIFAFSAFCWRKIKSVFRMSTLEALFMPSSPQLIPKFHPEWRWEKQSKMIYHEQTNQAEGPIYPYGRCFLLSPLWFPKNELISGLVILSKPKVRLYLRDPVNEAKSLRWKGFTIVTLSMFIQEPVYNDRFEHCDTSKQERCVLGRGPN